MTHEHHEREVVVDRGGGMGVGMIVGIILAFIVILALVWIFVMGGLDGAPGGEQQQEINIEAPDAPDVQPPGDGDGGGGGDGD